jgi:hypothetical protein
MGNEVLNPGKKTLLEHQNLSSGFAYHVQQRRNSQKHK